jgi:hypothetical protein
MSSLNNIQFNCPYCRTPLPSPSRARKCSNCGKMIYVRKKPSGEKVWIKEEDIPLIEQEWEIYRKKQIFIEEASETRSFIYNEFDRLEAQAKKAFKDGNKDEAWRLHNQAFLKAGEKFSDPNWAERFRKVYSAMACQLAADEKYKESLIFFAKEIYWACIQELLEKMRYKILFGFQEKNITINLLELNAENILPPFILTPILIAIEFAQVNLKEFENIFLKENSSEQQLATKLLHRHEEMKFEIPKPEIFWEIIGKVVKDNLELKIYKF